MARIRMKSHVTSGIVLASISLFLIGCSPEKAEALLTATEVFKNEAQKAISAYEELLLAGLETPTLSEKEAIADIIYRANDFSRKGEKLSFSGITLGLQDPFKSGKNEVRTLVQRQNMLYDAFVDSLNNLSRGSYFAGSAVQCSEEMARRLVVSLAQYQTSLNSRRVNLVVPEEDAVENLNIALAENADASEQARKIFELFNRKRALNEKVILQASVAAEAGVKVVNVAGNYDKFSAEDIIKLAREALVVAGTINGIDSIKAVGRLNRALIDAQGDEHWQRILAMEVYSAGTKCNPIESNANQ